MVQGTTAIAAGMIGGSLFDNQISNQPRYITSAELAALLRRRHDGPRLGRATRHLQALGWRSAQSLVSSSRRFHLPIVLVRRRA